VIRAAVVTAAGDLVARSSGRRLSRRLPETLADASQHLENVLAGLGEEQRSRLKGMVVAIPAPVHRDNQEGASEYFPAWGEGPLDELLAKRLDIPNIPIAIVNDAVTRAISEGRFGLARASHSAFVFKISGGIGGSMLRRGRILRGFRGYAGEVGHLGVSLSPLQSPPQRLELASLMPDARCSCDDVGGQHLEAYASTSAIARRHQHDAGPHANFDIVAAEWQSDDRAKKCIEDAARLIGQVALSVATVYDPEVIVVTGRFAACGDAALNPIRDSLRGNRLMAGDPPAVLVDGPGELGEDGWEWVGVQGAGRLAIERNTSAEEPMGSVGP
jgi:predicted NBD/HSP70 family sugar kinase